MPTYEPGTPSWFLDQLYARLVARRPKVARLWRYYDGEHPLAFASVKFRETFGGLFEAFADNWCPVVVDAVEERLNVEGFRIDPTDSKGDAEAWRIWQENGLDAESQLGHTESLVAGTAYATAWYGPDPLSPVITIEPADNAILACSPQNRRTRLAGLRTYIDEWGYEHAELFLPDRVWLFRTNGKVDGSIPVMGQRSWIPDTTTGADVVVDGDGAWMPNPLGVVPMVALENRPRLKRHRRIGEAAQSELAGVIPVQDAVNKIISDMLVASESAAKPQRLMAGFEAPPADPITGAPVNPFTPDKDVWIAPAGVTPHQFSPADIGNYVKGVEALVQHIASQSRTPPHYFYLSGQFPSGESIKSAETGLVSKSRRKMRHFGEAWEEIVGIGLQIIGDTRPTALAETIWGDPESRTESEHVDAILKKQALGVPVEQLWEDLGYSPQQITRFRAMRTRDALLTPPAPTEPAQPAAPVIV